uniref:BMP5/7-like n=1 Tax=Phallusia mammillata TaxID=59560 RepID=A0A6F9D7W0_9ASCI|nr:BMP5/7-like [Phallusia mammillata]
MQTTTKPPMCQMFSKDFFCIGRVYLYFLSVMTIVYFTHVESYILTHEGATRTYLHKRLVGRQRREIQREILSVLGLNHRPRPSGVRAIEKTSAPLYMLGLYNKVSLENIGLQTNSISSNRYENIRQPSPLPAGIRLTTEMEHAMLPPSLNRYLEDSGIMSNEVGVFDSQRDPHNNSPRVGTYNNILTNEIETQLLDDSDLVMSFVNTRNHNDFDDAHITSNHLQNVLRRHRSYFFDTSHVTLNDRLTAAKFRLYKEHAENLPDNSTLRINVYQVVLEPLESVGVILLGSRLVESSEQGWLVFDATRAARDWINYPHKNLGLKVSVETIEGRNIKPSVAAIVGRKGESSKQAFIVAFFSQNGEVNLMDHVRKRHRRSLDLSTETDETGNGDERLSENTTENLSPQTTNSLVDVEDDLENELEEVEHESDEEENTTTNGRGNSSSNVDQKTNSKRGTKKGQKSKNRKRKRRKKPTCGRRDLYVNFQDLDWGDWIIAPLGYAAYYCSGECDFPLNAHVNATNHAIVQALVHLLDQKNKPPTPCCSPTSLSGISVLYFTDNSNVVYKKYQNMVVKSCGCH